MTGVLRTSTKRSRPKALGGSERQQALAARSFERANQTVQHSADFFGIRGQDRGFFGADDFDTLRYFDSRLQFVARTARESKMVDVFGRVMSPEPFRDV
jgi:hypothetical protein